MVEANYWTSLAIACNKYILIPLLPSFNHVIATNTIAVKNADNPV